MGERAATGRSSYLVDSREGGRGDSCDEKPLLCPKGYRGEMKKQKVEMSSQQRLYTQKEII